MINTFVLMLLCTSNALVACAEITPHKLKDPSNLPEYTIPASARFTVSRANADEPDVVYYISQPKTSSYPIAILCTGSSSENSIFSVIHFHRYFLQEFMDMGVGVVTAELWGVDGTTIDKKEFIEHYTRSQRLHDHIAVIENIIAHPPQGWNGKFVFLGVSEGGPLVLSLTERYQNHLIATINWCGAGAWNWREELWAFIQDMRCNGPWWLKSLDGLARWLRLSSLLGIPVARTYFDTSMNEALKNPITTKKFMGMTYKYHADTLTYPEHNYAKFQKPLLVVAGAKDSIIPSCDEFVENAYATGANITYLRIDDMDHYIRKRPEIVEQSFAWLQEQMRKSYDEKL